jgi:O-antigen ligase
MIQDRPIFGVGPVMIPQERAYYGANPRISDDFYMHLHNNVIQIAAERGVPTLIFWFWLLGSIMYTNWNTLRRRRGPGRLESLFYPAAAIGGVVCLFVSGLFEYNFGDSEVLILFLVLTGLSSFDQENSPDHPTHETP